MRPNATSSPTGKTCASLPASRTEGKRFFLLDTLRGGAVIAMVIYHALYDIDVFTSKLGPFFASPSMQIFHAYIIGSFFLLCGIGCALSRSNIRRGIKIVAIAYGITLVTWFLGDAFYIRFGVLHCLGFSCILYGLIQRICEKIPLMISALFFAAAFVLCFFTLPQLTQIPYLYMFGLIERSFASADYFPLLPWTFLVLIGTCLGRWLKQADPAPPFLFASCPPLAFIGRHALVVYVLHQPVVYALVWGGMLLLGRA